MSLEFRVGWDTRDGDINWGGINTEMIFKAMRLDETARKVSVDRKEKRPEPWDSPALQDLGRGGGMRGNQQKRLTRSSR